MILNHRKITSMAIQIQTSIHFGVHAKRSSIVSPKVKFEGKS